jgi:phosphoglycerate dehydrogenase-like enzyme
MDGETILVIGYPGDGRLAFLEAAAVGMKVVVGADVEDFAEAAPEATVILGWAPGSERLGRVLLMAPEVRWVHIMAAGLDGAISPVLVQHPAVVTNGRGAFSRSLGEWAVGAILYFAKDFRRLLRNQMEGRWEQFEVDEVFGRTVGIVGYGDIGRAVAAGARALGMRVLGLTRRGPLPGRDDDLAEQIFGPAGLIEMIGQSDYIVVTAPLTAETRGLVGVAAFAAMKPEAVLINIGRGPIVNEAALLQALSERSIRGAALDVFDQEPLPAGHPFYALENVLLSPHSADHTAVWLDNAMQVFIDNLGRYSRGEALFNVVDKDRGY